MLEISKSLWVRKNGTSQYRTVQCEFSDLNPIRYTRVWICCDLSDIWQGYTLVPITSFVDILSSLLKTVNFYCLVHVLVFVIPAAGDLWECHRDLRCEKCSILFSLFYRVTTTPMCYCFVCLCCRQVCTFQCCCWKHANLRCCIHLAVYSSYLGKTSDLLFCLCLLNVKRCDNSEVTCSNWQMLLILYCVECILCCAVFHYCGVQLTT